MHNAIVHHPELDGHPITDFRFLLPPGQLPQLYNEYGVICYRISPWLDRLAVLAVPAPSFLWKLTLSKPNPGHYINDEAPSKRASPSVGEKNDELNCNFIFMKFFGQWFMDMTVFHIKKRNYFKTLHDF